jgi:hypothetical protein
MTDPIEDVLAPAVIERAMSLFESFRERNHCEVVQARKALTPHVFGLIWTDGSTALGRIRSDLSQIVRDENQNG